MDKEKRERLNRQFEAAKMQMAMSLAPLGEQLLRAVEAYEAALARAEIEYQEAAAFYRDWIGKTPPRFKRFLDWYFETKGIEGEIELLSSPSAIKEEDIEAAALWLAAKIKENRKAGHEKPQAGQALPEKEGLAFEGLFILPSVPALVIRAMQEAEPKPLLNGDGEGILFGKATVAPLMALVDILFDRKLAKEEVTRLEAYGAICARFGFDTSTRPDKARKDGAGIYQDYKEAFRLFFLSNRPG